MRYSKYLKSVTCSIILSHLGDNVEKYDVDDNMAHAQCMLDTLGYRHTLGIYNTCRFSTATLVVQMGFSVRSIRILPLLYKAY